MKKSSLFKPLSGHSVILFIIVLFFFFLAFVFHYQKQNWEKVHKYGDTERVTIFKYIKGIKGPDEVYVTLFKKQYRVYPVPIGKDKGDIIEVMHLDGYDFVVLKSFEYKRIRYYAYYLPGIILMLLFIIVKRFHSNSRLKYFPRNSNKMNRLILGKCINYVIPSIDKLNSYNKKTIFELNTYLWELFEESPELFLEYLIEELNHKSYIGIYIAGIMINNDKFMITYHKQFGSVLKRISNKSNEDLAVNSIKQEYAIACNKLNLVPQS